MLKDIVEVESLTQEENDKLIAALEANTDEFTTLKFVEEVAELQEKLIKYHLKSKDHKPEPREILDEIGDVTLRMLFFIERLDKKHPELESSDYLGQRIEKKLTKMYGYVRDGKYVKGI